MKKSYLTWGVLFSLLFLVLLVASAPARLLTRVVPPNLALLQGVSGTVWQGSASSVQLRLPQGYFQLGSTSWSLRPLSLLLLSPRVSLNSQWGSQVVSADVVLRGRRDLEIIDLDLQFVADTLRHFAPVAVDGMFSLQVTGMELRDGLPHSAQGRLVWQSAAWQSPKGPVPLGSYALDFQQAPGEALLGEVITINGPLQANGQAELDGRAYSVDVLMGSDEMMESQLEQMLSLISAPEGDDYRVVVSGDF